jgi:hypothetical protein
MPSHGSSRKTGLPKTSWNALLQGFQKDSKGQIGDAATTGGSESDNPIEIAV